MDCLAHLRNDCDGCLLPLSLLLLPPALLLPPRSLLPPRLLPLELLLELRCCLLRSEAPHQAKGLKVRASRLAPSCRPADIDQTSPSK
jgi:hypothetical protein